MMMVNLTRQQRAVLGFLAAHQPNGCGLTKFNLMGFGANMVIKLHERGLLMIGDSSVSITTAGMAAIGKQHNEDAQHPFRRLVEGMTSINESNHVEHAARLKAAVHDKAAWDKETAGLENHPHEYLHSLAHAFGAFVPNRASRKRLALSIHQERSRQVHAKSKAASAAKTRLW